jgi:hypothetical protein
MQKQVQIVTETGNSKAIARDKGKFKKGVSANPAGRAKGSVTKKTAIVQSFTDTMLSGGADKFKRELMKLKGRDYVNAFMTLLEYSLPKKQRMEHTDADGGPVKIHQVFVIAGKEIVL